MSFAPPPPPMGLPPPPPTGMHHHAHAPPPPMMMQHHMQAARPIQILLTHVPSFLHNSRLLRDWILSAGSARSVLLVPPQPQSSEGETAKNQNVTALVTMSHADAALKVLTAFRHFALKLKDTEFAEFAVHAVPTNPDIPMPPAVMDAETVQVLGDNLHKAFQRYREGDGTAGNNGTANRAPNSSGSTADELDRQEAAAATSGGGAADDDDLDPLETPAVLEAVRKFREQLTVQQGSKAVKRQQLVADAIGRMLPVVRQRVREEREQRAAAAAATAAPPFPPNSALLLPPPPPGGALPFPPPPPPPPTLDAPRGVSNMPAWMTQQQQQQQADNSNLEPPAKKLKMDFLADPAAGFPTIPEGSVAALRQFIGSSIRRYLGEEEATDLIDFVHAHVVAGKSVEALLPDLSDVLDEDATAFLASVYEYTNSQQQAVVELG